MSYNNSNDNDNNNSSIDNDNIDDNNDGNDNNDNQNNADYLTPLFAEVSSSVFEYNTEPFGFCRFAKKKTRSYGTFSTASIIAE